MKMLIWVALAAMAPGMASMIRVLICGVMRGRRQCTWAPDFRTPQVRSAAWATPAAITPQEAARHPYRNVITRCLGMQVDVEADTQQRELKPGDRLLICSDGLSGLVSDDEMLQHVLSSQDPQQTCQELVNLANERGGSDNITVVLIFND